MTRRHFVRIADAFRDLYADDSLDNRTLDRVVSTLIPVFRWANSGFDSQRFINHIHKQPVR